MHRRRPTCPFDTDCQLIGRSESYAKLGAFHGLETPLRTGWLRPSHWGEVTANDQRMIDLLTGYWTKFARTGDPDAARLPPWPKYDSKADQVQELGREVKQRPIPHGRTVPSFRAQLEAPAGASGKGSGGNRADQVTMCYAKRLGKNKQETNGVFRSVPVCRLLIHWVH